MKYGFEVVGIDIIPQTVPGGGGLMGTAGAVLGPPIVQSVVGKGEDAVIAILNTLFAGFKAERKVKDRNWAGSPRAVARPGFPLIRTCPSKASGSSSYFATLLSRL